MRSIWKRLLFTSVITVAVTVLLSALPHNFKNRTAMNGDVAVFRSVPVKRLSSDNLVDSMLGLQLTLKLKRVVWNQAVLSVDLSVEGNDSNTQLWMGDLERLLYLAFIKAENVNRVLVRFVEPGLVNESGYETTRFIAATDIRRTDSWLTTDLSKLGSSDPFTDIIWKQRLRLSISGNSSKVSSL
ncbi:hypothetical protein Back11_23430 [Paenibacillus baekrokdamisoli]|uniref:Uncharacterized protein n=1 Tax=Paenibacillus baekrokdamisoli TaxID=1712516 RepID=A0A3G9JAX5_9BACL|nr:hypothetical protein [Paenibacillus baekrokdamisoli]MBB3069648.1 hypothetical protein [Paenibacillus baekrokdamisoli]BBH20998.1 hypothetical protein Back11_23430 [Paenibacillus baekrokdamisoli]